MLQVGGPIKEVPTLATNLRRGDKITLTKPGGSILTVKESTTFGPYTAVHVEEFDYPFTIPMGDLISVWVDA